MITNLKKKMTGFTIIEVLIVLAIAGLIMLIVFLAVPALQRNARNTQRRNNVGTVLAAVTEFTANNNGSLPALACGSSNPYKFITGTCATPTGVATEFNQGYYTAAPTIASGVSAAPVTDTLTIVTGAKCAAAGATIAGGARQVAAQYMLEAGGALAAVCQEG